jgi:hypothetical protein
MTEYAVIDSRALLREPGPFLHRGFDSVTEAAEFIADWKIKRCRIIALDEPRRWLDGDETAELNRAIASRSEKA